MPLPLHIFETRYKQMIRECLEGEGLFGVVLIRHGSEALGPLAEPYEIGCTARISEAQPLEEGRMQITAIGERRFKIYSLSQDLPYLVGQVDYYSLDMEAQESLEPITRQLTSKVRQYVQLLNQVDTIDLNPEELPEDPQELAYLAAILLQMPPQDKQMLLTSQNILEMLKSTNQAYTREIAFLEAIITRGKDQTQARVSWN